MTKAVKLLHATLALAITAMLAACGTTAHIAATQAPKPCSELQGLSIPASVIGLASRGATVTSAMLKSGTGSAVPAADFVPEFCMIDGVIDSVSVSAPGIHFRVVVPTQWNGNAIQVGGNGFNGFVPRLASFIRGAAGSPQGAALPPNRPYPIAQGYALFGSDSGHTTGNGKPPGWTPNTPDDGDPPKAPAALGAGAQGGPPPGFNFEWMKDREALQNYAHEQIKKTHDVAHYLIKQLRNKAPQHTYFMGESQGGRDALMAASVYGADYDGVLVSVPLAYFTGIMLNTVYLTKLQFDPAAYVPPSKQATLESYVLAQCDAMDGLADGVINHYLGCYKRFDATLTPKPFAPLRCANGADTAADCLSDAQIITLEKTFSPMVYGYPMRNGESDWAGNAIGAKGVGNGSLARYLLRQPPDPAKAELGVAVSFKSLLGEGRSFEYFNRTHAELQSDLQAVSAVLDAPMDWSKLFAHGGKLVFHTAGNDYLTNARSHLRVYDTLLAKHGQAAMNKAVRFYVTPNGNHASAGINSLTGEPTPQYMDLITALTDWVEKGKPPADALTQTFMKKDPPYDVVRSRPLCRYPSYPHYNGSGSPELMTSYRCQP